MSRSVRRLFASLCATAMLFVVAASPAAAQNNSQQNGLVNVSVGDVEVLNNVSVGAAINAAANICGVQVSQIAVLANQVARNGQATVCTAETGNATGLTGPVVISR